MSPARPGPSLAAIITAARAGSIGYAAALFDAGGWDDRTADPAALATRAVDHDPWSVDALMLLALVAKWQGDEAAAIDRLVYGNPVKFLSQSPRFKDPAAQA